MNVYGLTVLVPVLSFLWRCLTGGLGKLPVTLEIAVSTHKFWLNSLHLHVHWQPKKLRLQEKDSEVPVAVCLPKTEISESFNSHFPERQWKLYHGLVVCHGTRWSYSLNQSLIRNREHSSLGNTLKKSDWKQFLSSCTIKTQAHLSAREQDMTKLKDASSPPSWESD